MRRRLSWPTRARPRPNRSRRPTATDDFLEALLPRTTTSRVSSMPTIRALTLIPLWRTGLAQYLRPGQNGTHAGCSRSGASGAAAAGVMVGGP